MWKRIQRLPCQPMGTDRVFGLVDVDGVANFRGLADAARDKDHSRVEVHGTFYNA